MLKMGTHKITNNTTTKSFAKDQVSNNKRDALTLPKWDKQITIPHKVKWRTKERTRRQNTKCHVIYDRCLLLAKGQRKILDCWIIFAYPGKDPLQTTWISLCTNIYINVSHHPAKTPRQTIVSKKFLILEPNIGRSTQRNSLEFYVSTSGHDQGHITRISTYFPLTPFEF